MLNEAELQGGATGLVQWKEHEAAQAEAERKRKAEEAAKARAEYEAAKAAAEEEERKRKAAEDAAAAAAAAEAAKPKPKKKTGFGGFLAKATAVAQDAVQVAKAAGEVAFAEGEKLYHERKAQLADLKAKAEAAQQEEAVPAKPLTFYEKMQLQAAKTEKSLDDYRQMTDMAMSKGIYAGEAEMAKVKAARAAEGESKE